MALVAGLILFALLDPPLGVYALVVGAVVEVGEAIFWTRYLKRYRIKTGVEALTGEKAEVITECRPLGKVRVRGELWAAECAQGAGEGETVWITAVRGLTLEVEPSAVHDALAANGCFTPTSLDAPLGGGDVGTHLGDRLGGADPEFARAEARVALGPLLAELSRRERRMLELRFFQGATQAEIGAEIGVTQMQVSRLLSALLTRIRERMTAPDTVAAA